MANYIVSDTNLTAVANAIRTKGGTSEQLEFPDDFVSAIGDIQTGGGGTDELVLLEQNQLTSRTSTATSVKSYMFYLNSVLTSVNYLNATSIGEYAFNNCVKLNSVSFPSITSMGQRAFSGCSDLEEVTINENFSGAIATFSFSSCVKLPVLDLKKATSISGNAFNGCTILNVLILRGEDGICTLASTTPFTNTPFASGGTGGTLYVPQDLISSYQSANNWKTILGYANNQIKAIEGSIYE